MGLTESKNVLVLFGSRVWKVENFLLLPALRKKRKLLHFAAAAQVCPEKVQRKEGGQLLEDQGAVKPVEGKYRFLCFSLLHTPLGPRISWM